MAQQNPGSYRRRLLTVAFSQIHPQVQGAFNDAVAARLKWMSLSREPGYGALEDHQRALNDAAKDFIRTHEKLESAIRYAGSADRRGRVIAKLLDTHAMGVEQERLVFLRRIEVRRRSQER
ncbi:MAG: hypothetical protein V1787_03135 [Candidatus Micrarchaeota archaeon]